jgi:hypothetical protein
MKSIKSIYSNKVIGFVISHINVLRHRLYNKIPSQLQKIAIPLIYPEQSFRFFLELRPKLWILNGNERISNSPVSILYASNDSNKIKITDRNYMLRLIFRGSYKERYIGRTWLWKVLKVGVNEGPNCSFILVQVHKSQRKLLRSSKWFYIPNWVSGEVDIPVPPQVLKKHTFRSDLRKFKKHSLQFKITRDLEDFDDFYHNMYVPHVTESHGNSAYIMPYEEKKTKFRNCDLLLVKQKEKSTAGLLIAYNNVGPRLWSFGIRDENREYVKEGTVTALMHFAMLYLKDKGFTKVNIGYTRAFARDGVFQYKRKWSQKIYGTSDYWFALKILKCSGAAGAFLQKNPFIFEKNGILNSAVFLDIKKPFSAKELKRIEKLNFTPGLSKLILYLFQFRHPIKQYNATPDLFERFVFCSVDDII